MHESAIEKYMNSEQIVESLRMNVGEWENFSKAEFKTLVDEKKKKKAKHQQEINLDTMFKELKKVQK